MIESDPAWFYSSVAQASAAVVGLVGAILGSRIIDHVNSMKIEKSEIDRELAALKSKINGRVPYLRSFKDYIISEISADRTAIESGETVRQVTGELYWGSSSGGSPRPIDPVAQIQKLEPQSAAIDLLLPIYPSFAGPAQSDSLFSLAAELAQTIAPLHPDAHRFVQADIDLLQHVGRRLESFQATILPRSFIAIVALLGWLSVFGVLLPLSALSALQHPIYSKSVVLGALSVGLLGLVAYFAYQLFRLKQIGTVRWP